MPTFTAAKSTEILFDGYNLSSYFKDASVPKSAEATETTTFGNDAKTYLGTLKDGSFSASGFLDESTTGGAGEILSKALGGDGHEVSVYPEGGKIGKFGKGLQVTDTSHEISAPLNGVVELSTEAQSSHAAERLVSLHAREAVTANGTATAVQNAGGKTTDGAVGYLHVTSIAGGTLTAKVQHSPNDVTYADLLTFTAVSGSNPASERKSATGEVDQYLRTVWTLNGGTATWQSGAGRSPQN